MGLYYKANLDRKASVKQRCCGWRSSKIIYHSSRCSLSCFVRQFGHHVSRYFSLSYSVGMLMRDLLKNLENTQLANIMWPACSILYEKASIFKHFRWRHEAAENDRACLVTASSSGQISYISLCAATMKSPFINVVTKGGGRRREAVYEGSIGNLRALVKARGHEVTLLDTGRRCCIAAVFIINAMCRSRRAIPIFEIMACGSCCVLNNQWYCDICLYSGEGGVNSCSNTDDRCALFGIDILGSELILAKK